MDEIYDPIPDDLIQKIRVMSSCDDVRDVPGYPGYAVTIDGQVWSVKGRGVQRGLAKVPRRLKTTFHKGFEIVKISAPNGIQSTYSIGRLLLSAFVGPQPSEGMQASFVDGNPQNLSLDNLKWVTESERTKQAITRRGSPFAYGEQLNHTKLTSKQVEEIRQAHAEGETVTNLAKQYRVAIRTARRAIRGEAWQHVDTPSSDRLDFARGERVNLAKLTEDDVRQIRAMVADGTTQTATAKQFGVDVTTVNQIVHRKTWKHI